MKYQSITVDTLCVNGPSHFIIAIYCRSVEAHLRAELDKVIEERDTLAAQIKSDAKMLENKVMAAKQQGMWHRN